MWQTIFILFPILIYGIGRCDCHCSGQFIGSVPSIRSNCTNTACTIQFSQSCVSGTFMEWEGLWTIVPSENIGCNAVCCFRTNNILIEDISNNITWNYRAFSSGLDSTFNLSCAFGQATLNFLNTTTRPTSQTMSVGGGVDYIQQWEMMYDIYIGRTYARAGFNTTQRWMCQQDPCTTNSVVASMAPTITTTATKAPTSAPTLNTSNGELLIYSLYLIIMIITMAF